MSTFATAYGSEVGCVGIKLIPTGGLYVTGGLTPKNIDWIRGKDSHFMTAFHDKGRVSPILENVPLLAVMVEDLGVRGALKNAQLEFEKFEARKNAQLQRTLQSGANILSSTRGSDMDLLSTASVVASAHVQRDLRGDELQADPKSYRILEMEKEAAYYKTLAQVTLAVRSRSCLMA